MERVAFELNDSDGPSCPVCCGPVTELGQLGQLMHFRCRNCGTDSMIAVEEWEEHYGG